MNKISKILQFVGKFEPIGSIKMYGGPAAPSGWLKCDGSAVSRTTYEKLFEAIGTAYGEGDGSTTFNLPNFNGRMPIGVGTSGTTGASSHALASTGGAETHTHTTGNFTLTTSHIPAHTHVEAETFHFIPYSDSRRTSTDAAGTYQFTSGNYFFKSKFNTGSTGGGQAHNHGATGATSQMNPYITVNFIIFAGQ